MKRPEPETLLEWTEDKDLESLGRYLVSGTVHGKPGLPTAELAWVTKTIQKAREPEARFKLAQRLALRPEYAARSLACRFLRYGWPKHARVLEKQLLALANDSDWIVRESAACLFGAMLEIDFGQFSKLFLDWLDSKSTEAKRAIALAVKYDSKARHPNRFGAYLKLIEPLLNHPDEYIRKNLGPFAIGDGLLPRYPDETLRALSRWAKQEDENTRWNVAMAFTAAHARKHCEPGLQVLEVLAADERRFVWRAVCSALRNLAKEDAKPVRARIARWAKDPKRAQVAEAAAKLVK